MDEGREVYVWGKIVPVQAGEIFVMASIVSTPNSSARIARVFDRLVHTEEEAEHARAELMLQAGAWARERGWRVVDTVDD